MAPSKTTVVIEHERASFFKNIVDAIKDIVPEASFSVTRDGLSIVTMDVSHVAMIHAFLSKDEFKKFEVSGGDHSLGVSLVDFSKILKCCSGSDFIRLSLSESKSGVMKVSSVGSSFNMKLMDIDSDNLEVPEMEFDYVESISGSELSRVMKGLALFGDSVLIRRVKEGLDFSSGESGSSLDEAKFHVASVGPFTQEYAEQFSIKHMLDFCKGAGLGGNVQLKLRSGMPICVEYDFGENSRIVYYMAPKVYDD